ncbi:MAG: hypothetical protein IPM64_09400 [Phycisphaerales bacterium]|nr:hypothetical protein [Phycisphaerales bacterium]
MRKIRPEGLIAPVLGAAAFVAALAWLSPLALLVAVTDSVLPALLLVSAAGWGGWPTRWLLRGSDVSIALRGLTAVVVGCGILAAVVLILGVTAALDATSAWMVVAGGIVLGGTALISRPMGGKRGIGGESAECGAGAAESGAASAASRAGSAALRGAALLAPVLCLAVMFFAATAPPGTFWIIEGNGYDVLEYHLQAPREYFDAGRIHFLPHNVYAQFPQQVELLYLMLMYLCGGTLEAAIPCQLLHALFGVLAVGAAAALSPAGWGRVAAVCITASVPWFCTVGALAYNELAGLLFAMVAAGLLLPPGRCDAGKGTSSAGDTTQPARSIAVEPGLRRIVLAGCCAGVAAGCKYTLLALVVVPLVVLCAAGAARRRSAESAERGARDAGS